MEYFEKILKNLEEKGETSFGFGDKYIYVQERVDGDYEYDIYNSRADYSLEVDCEDGGIFTGKKEDLLEFITEGLY